MKSRYELLSEMLENGYKTGKSFKSMSSIVRGCYKKNYITQSQADTLLTQIKVWQLREKLATGR